MTTRAEAAERDARILKAYESLPDKFGYMKVLSARFGLTPSAIHRAIKRAHERQSIQEQSQC